jgi:hypothetical protein
MSSEVQITKQDLIAMIAFEAQRIVSASQLYAAGHPMPSPLVLKGIIEKMAGLNNVLGRYESLLPSQNPELEAQGSVKVEFN